MKIAIESNDGETINSPFDKPKGYLVFDVEDTGIKETKYIKLQTPGKKSETVSPGKTKNINRQSFPFEDCCTIITRGMENKHRIEFKEKGVEVFITFNTRAKDAVRAYLRERLINKPLVH
jgi:predicted Fe-Mo cluster-binding NifX family protein